jgi:methylated-DNA-[protein]-cysteine S-methyltransferase
MASNLKTLTSKVYLAIKKIPTGKVSTYQEVARAVGYPNAARAVGSALAKNPTLVIIPCHRVVKSDGRIGNYVKGQKQKERLLKKEGILVKKGKIIDFDKVLFKFKK